MNNLTPYQKRLYKLLHKPGAVLRFFYDGSGCEGYHFSIEYAENGTNYEKRLTEETFTTLDAQCRIVRRYDQGREHGYAYWYTAKPADLLTDEDRAWINDYESQTCKG